MGGSTSYSSHIIFILAPIIFLCYHKGLSTFIVLLRPFLFTAPFPPFLMEKGVKMHTKMISTRKWHAKHPFGGQNTKQKVVCKF